MAASNTVGVLLVAGAAFIGVEALKGFKDVGSSSSSSGGGGAALDTGGAFPAGGVPLPAGPWVNRVIAWANQNGIDPAFPLALIAQESGGSATAHNRGTPGHPEDSYGFFQINLNAHSPAGPGASYAQNVACAENIDCALRYWGSHIGSGYFTHGGTAQFHAGPQAFLQRVVPSIQGSIAWSSAQAQAAYAQAQAWLRGGR